MNAAAARLSLTDMVNEGSIEEVPRDGDVPNQLLDQANRHVKTASAGIDFGDDEGAFQLAYDACRKTALALLLATGHRPFGDGHHATTFEAGAAIAHSIGPQARQIVEDAGNLRFVRNNVQYRGELISHEDATEAIEIATEIIAALTPAISALTRGGASG